DFDDIDDDIFVDFPETFTPSPKKRKSPGSDDSLGSISSISPPEEWQSPVKRSSRRSSAVHDLTEYFETLGSSKSPSITPLLGRADAGKITNRRNVKQLQ